MRSYASGMPADNDPTSATPISLKQFFESTPPGTWVVVADLAETETSRTPVPPPRVATRLRNSKLPDLQLHCDSDDCKGARTFYTQEELAVKENESKQLFVSYFCRNCRMSVKTYAIQARRIVGDAEVFKYGEFPAFGPPLPSKLIALIRPEWGYFLKGRRAENQGLGIGAFAYYRRVIESQKNRILDELIKAAGRLSASQELINELEEAKRNIQFKKAIEGVKHGMPPALLIEDTNPLTLLHSALSIGLHGETDEECLAAATDIRIVMAELAERLDAIVKEHSELKESVARLLKKNSSSRDRAE